MKISLIAALDKNGVIGKDNAIPWRLPADVRYFKRVTMGKPIIMGRKTYESIGRPLPGRTNIVLTRDEAFQAEGCLVVHSVDEALAAAGEAEEVMVIGGAAIYQEFLPGANRLYLTFIDHAFEGDTTFPPIQWDEWREISRQECQPDEKNAFGYRFVVLERVTA